MNIFQERYFSFNKKLLVIMGLWPFGPSTRIVRKYLLLFTLFAMILPHVISMKTNSSNIDTLMLDLVIILIAFLMFLKMLSMIVAENKMKALYRNIADNWLGITDEKEKEILVEYSERGRKKAIAYFVFMQGGSASVFALPTIPKILDIINPLPESRQTLRILEGDVFLDKDTYYWLYYFLDVITVIVNGVVTVCNDTIYIICVEQCCAYYAIIRHRFHNLKSKIIDSSTENEVNSYDYVIGIIRLHQSTLNFTETVNDAFSMLFLYILIANMACIPLCAVTVLSNLDEPYNFLRFGMLLILLITHLFMLFWPGQNVLDHGTELIDDAYYNEWYATPVRTKKMIIFFMIRCSRPSLLAAGGLMLMNFETFSMIIRTAVSYITVVASFR